MANASALFRSLLVYGVCLPLAVFLGYLLATPLDMTTLAVVLIVLTVLTFPLFLRWHHAWLIAVWNSTALIFFLPGKPQLWIGLAALSLMISLLQYTLNRNMRFLSVPSVVRPLVLLTAVILITMRLTGGIGLQSFGSATHGGKGYFVLLAAIVGYFALINRRIPTKRASLYVTLFFLGGATLAIADLPGVISPSLNFIFYLFPVNDLDAFWNQKDVFMRMELMPRWLGVPALGGAVFSLMLARYGVRGILEGTKPWRLAVFCLFSFLAMLGGFRSTFVQLTMTFAVIFYLERLHHTRLLLPMVFVSLAGVGLMFLFATRLPLAFQRSLTVVPFVQLDPLARLSAQVSTDWRVQVWKDVVPEIPRYLLVGKGYSFSGAEREKVARDATESSEMVGNYHNGPLSVIIPFGMFGSIAFVWLLAAGTRVLYQNYQFGDPALHYINTFLFGSFVVKIAFFFIIFGSLVADLPAFLGLLGLSISLNGGVAKPVVVPRPKIVFNRFKLHPSVQRPLGA